MKEDFENEEKLNENIDEIEDNEEVTEEVESEKKVKKAKKSKKIKLAIILAVIAAIIILFVATPYKLLFSTKKMTVLTYLVNDAENISELAEDVVENEFFTFINDKETKLIDIKLNVNDKNLSGNTVIDEDYFALKLDEVNSNYYLIETKKINELFEKLGMSEYEISSDVNIKKLLNLSNGEIRKIKKFASNCFYEILENVDDEDIKIDKNSTLTINSEKKNVEVVELNLSESKFFEVQKIVLERFLEDGIFDILAKKLEILTNADKNELKSTYEEYIEYLDNYINYIISYHKVNNVEESNFIIYKMYKEEDDIISREVISKTTYNDSVYEDIILSLITIDDYYELKSFTQIDQSAAYYNILSDRITEENNVKNHDISYKIDGFTVDRSEEGLEFAYTPILIENNYYILVDDTTDYTKVKFADAENKNIIEIDYNKENIKAKIESNNENKVNITVDAKKDKTITNKSLIENGAIDLTTKTKEEIMDEFNKIATKLGEIM